MTFFTLGNHHDFAVLAIGDDAEDPPAKSAGLFHIAFKIGDSVDELPLAERAHVELRVVVHVQLDVPEAPPGALGRDPHEPVRAGLGHVVRRAAVRQRDDLSAVDRGLLALLDPLAVLLQLRGEPTEIP